jgi:hypothetical protein
VINLLPFLLFCCIQVTAKLAAMCLQALQWPDERQYAPALAFEALGGWLDKAVTTMRPAPDTRAAAAVRQQLQESQLLQRLGPAMDAAAAQLTAAIAALAAAVTTTVSSSTGTTQQHSIQQQMARVEEADEHCVVLMSAMHLISCALSQQASFGTETALPAAPAAVRLILAGYQACGRLQKLWQVSNQQLPQKLGK